MDTGSTPGSHKLEVNCSFDHCAAGSILDWPPAGRFVYSIGAKRETHEDAFKYLSDWIEVRFGWGYYCSGVKRMRILNHYRLRQVVVESFFRLD
jgi:hypothetical protein